MFVRRSDVPVGGMRWIWSRTRLQRSAIGVANVRGGST